MIPSRFPQKQRKRTNSPSFSYTSPTKRTPFSVPTRYTSPPHSPNRSPRRKRDPQQSSAGQNKTLQQTIKTQILKIQSLNDKVSEGNRVMFAKDMEISRLQQEMEILKNNDKQKLDFGLLTKDKNRMLQNELNGKDKEIEKLRLENKESINSLEKEMSAIKKKKELIKDNYKTLEAETKAHQKQVEQLMLENDRLKKEVKEKKMN
eukprot:UN30480